VVAEVDVETDDAPTAVVETSEEEGGSRATVHELAMSRRITTATSLGV
jgi:hypothetical protein